MIFMPLILAMAGLLMDTAHLTRQYQALQGAVDAASLAATHGYDPATWEREGRVVLVESEACALARRYLSRNMPSATLTRCEVAGSQVVVRAQAVVPFFFARVLGLESKVIEAGTRSARR